MVVSSLRQFLSYIYLSIFHCSDTYILTRECAVCFDAKPEQEFHLIHSETCQHPYRHICNSCTYYSVKAILDSAIGDQVFCPEINCRARWSSDEIRRVLFVNNDHWLLEKYDDHLIRQDLDNDDHFFWCAHGCGSGQYYDMNRNPNLRITCIVCNKDTCVFHRVPWHEGMTCEQYDQLHPYADELTRSWVETNTKKCPYCQCNIEKDGGCDHMTCKRCGKQFNWGNAVRHTRSTNYGHVPHQLRPGPSFTFETNNGHHPRGKLASLLRLLKFRS